MKILSEYVNEKYNCRSNTDRRKKVDWYLIEYQDEKGISYRKSFEFPVGTKRNDVLLSIPQTI